jgi:hypothetical protein
MSARSSVNHPNDRSVIGRYRRPDLKLVGDQPLTGARPIDPCQPVYGLDYRYIRTTGRHPVRWPVNEPVLFRLTDLGDEALTTTIHNRLAEVVDQLIALTGLDLRVAEPSGSVHSIDDVPVGTVMLRGCSANPCSSSQLDGPNCYRRGVVDLRTNEAMRTGSLVPLKHSLGHALGLGHPLRTTSLMHASEAERPADYTAADRYALAMLGTAARR